MQLYLDEDTQLSCGDDAMAYVRNRRVLGDEVYRVPELTTVLMLMYETWN